MSERHPEPNRSPSFPLPANSRIGILGGGQLGRMTALAAARLGLQSVIYTPEENSPAAQVADAAVVADWDDAAAVARFLGQVDAVTLEFENVPVDLLRRIGETHAMRPGPRALEVAQDRLAEKSFVRDAGIGTAPFAEVNGPSDLDAALPEIGPRGVLKTRRFGYDGKGQTFIESADDAEAAWRQIGEAPAILEAFVPFEREVSVIVARDAAGALCSYDVVDNVHEAGRHILSRTTAPSTLPPETAAAAVAAAETLARALEIVGLLAVEFFVLEDGKVWVNEIAPRPHNSGHWTMDACLTDQFEQLVRAVAGLPLGPATRLHDAVMHNILGDEMLAMAEAGGGVPEDALAQWLGDPDVRLHLYGKAEARAGRKMGHINRLLPLTPAGNAARPD